MEIESVYKSAAPIDAACMAVATLWAQLRSKDPSTKVGACVYHPKSGALFLGYNGFPSGIPDFMSVWNQKDRTKSPNKYQYCVHAETSAVRRALSVFQDLSECLMYVTHYPCSACMRDTIIPSGLKTVVYMQQIPVDDITDTLARVAGIKLVKARTDIAFRDEAQLDWGASTPKGIIIIDA